MEEENRGTCWLVILAHTPVIYMFTPKPPTPMKSVSFVLSAHTFSESLCSYKCFSVCVCVQVCVKWGEEGCGWGGVSVCMCVYTCMAQKVNSFCQKKSCGKNLKEKASSSLSICDMEPKRACSHFLLAWSNTAQSQLQLCQKVFESAEGKKTQTSMLPKISLGCCK